MNLKIITVSNFGYSGKEEVTEANVAESGSETFRQTCNVVLYSIQ